MRGWLSISTLFWASEKAGVRQPPLILFPFCWVPFLILLPALGVGDPRECRGDVAFPPSFGPPLFILPFLFATVSSKQSSAEGTEACMKTSATMSPVGTDDTLGIRMQCVVFAWLFGTLYP